MMSSFKKSLFDILEGHSEGRHARLFAFAMMGFIILNVVAVVLDSVELLAQEHARFFWAFEILSVAVFTAEYACRVWACTATPGFRGGLRGRLRFMLTPLALVDLLAILPFYLSATVIDLRSLRLIRLVRLVRVFKLGRYSEAAATLRRVFGAKKEELAVSVLIMILLMTIGSTLIYEAENGSQPEVFSSIPEAFWWASMTMSNVNYVDVHPITPFGRFIGVALTLLDVALLAVPTAILGSGFVEEFHKSKEAALCPHCGQSIEGVRSTPRRMGRDSAGESDLHASRSGSKS